MSCTGAAGLTESGDSQGGADYGARLKAHGVNRVPMHIIQTTAGDRLAKGDMAEGSRFRTRHNRDSSLGTCLCF
jgi:hypothetical protein